MKRLARLRVRAIMALLLIVVLVSIVVVPIKADESTEKPFKAYLPLFVNPKIEGLEPPEFGEEFLVSESMGGSVNGADIVFANNNEGLAAWQQEVRVCPPDKTYCEIVLQVFSQHFSTETGLAGKLLLGESKFPIDKEQIETSKQKQSVLYHGGEMQTSGTGLAAVLETSGWAGNPSVAWNAVSGNYLVAFWSNAENEEGWSRIYAWQIAGDRKLGTAKLRVGDDGENVYRQFYPAVAVSPEGNYLVVWEQDSYEEPNAFQIFGQWLDQNAQPIGENFQISTGIFEQHPKLTYVAQRDAFLVVYMYPYMDYEFHVEIRGQWISSGETGEPFVISEDTLDKSTPSLAVSSQGDILVVWSADGKIYRRLILPTGILLDTRVSAEENGQLLNHPKIASFDKDGFMLTWEEFPPNGCADKSRVWGKILKIVKPKFFFEISPDRTLIVAGKPFQLSQNEVNQRFPGIGTWDSNGLAVWEVDNGDSGLRGRFFEKTLVRN